MNEKERAVMQQALEALEYENSWHESFKVRPYASTIDAVAALRAVLSQEKIEPVQEKVSKMTASRAVYFMERFKREEKLLGPNEQAALDFVISMLERQEQAEPVQEPVAWTYEWKHRLHGGSLNVSRARWPESHLWIETPLYASPPRKPLTEEEILRIKGQFRGTLDVQFVDFTRAVERAHGIKE